MVAVVVSLLLSALDSVFGSLVLGVAVCSRFSEVFFSLFLMEEEVVWSGPIAIEGRGSSDT